MTSFSDGNSLVKVKIMTRKLPLRGALCSGWNDVLPLFVKMVPVLCILEAWTVWHCDDKEDYTLTKHPDKRSWKSDLQVLALALGVMHMPEGNLLTCFTQFWIFCFCMQKYTFINHMRSLLWKKHLNRQLIKILPKRVNFKLQKLPLNYNYLEEKQRHF
jgi:hypothetical protein